ncbi:substrate-binding domain-containing protein [Nocardioides solisilvae]|uniref:substrate-binding domain-containing protein n=1 Tax=Nocardioides solisilvae TaxID=1542435 RepID=UPI0013A5BA71|nr:substrate-binding domain-containing protein [Nocardioides solisilvae]
MGRHALDKDGKGLSPLLLVLALVAVIGGVGWLTMGGALEEDAAVADTCQDPFEVRLATVPAMRPLVEQAVTATAQRNRCAAVEVVEETPDQTSAAFARNESPDLWVADSSLRMQRLASSGVSTALLEETLAASPVGLVTGPTGAGVGSWREALVSGRTVLNDPASDAASALALTASMGEALSGGTDPVEAQLSMIPLAQKFGERTVDGPAEPIDLGSIGNGSTQLLPISEHDFLKARAANAALTLVKPATGSPVLDFPLAAAWDSDNTLREYGQELGSWFRTDEGARALDAAGLRRSTVEPLSSGGGMGQVEALETPSDDLVLRTLGGWQVLSVPSSILAVFDASGSMDFPAGAGSTRMELAADAAGQALSLFPRHAKVGTWAFSIDQGGPGQDWRQLAPIKRLNERTAGIDHERYLRQQLTKLLSITQGGTGLYDTTLAAYRQGLRSYDKNYFNAVILISDGANDDPGSLSLPDLLDKLKESADPARPVRIISVGISEDADMPSLRRISEATGGQAFLAKDPRDMLDVFAQALLSR